MAIDEKWLSPDSVDIACVLGTAAELAFVRGDVDSADVASQRALDIFTHAGLSNSVHAAEALLYRGSRDSSRTSLGGDREKIDEALLIWRANDIPALELVRTAFDVAIALDRARPKDPHAIQLAKKALAGLGLDASLEERRREIEAWLTARTPRLSRHGDIHSAAVSYRVRPYQLIVKNAEAAPVI
jgi:hypothetical protein